MSVKRIAKGRWIGLSTDTKPVAATADVPIGATFYAYDVDILYISYDGTNWTIKTDPEPYLYRIAEGKITGKESWFKIAYNPTLGASAIIMPNDQASYTWPTADKQPVLASSDAEDDLEKADTNPGTGIHEVTVTYLDTDLAEQTEDVELNGTAEVTMTADNVRRINNIQAKTVGTGGSAAGNIYIKDATGGNIIGYIAAGNNCNRVGVYTVPAGKTLYITELTFSGVHTAANKRAIVKLSKSTGGVFTTCIETTLVEAPITYRLTMPLVFDAETDMMFRGLSDGTATVHIFANGWVE
jgi:hypothetical protein